MYVGVSYDGDEFKFHCIHIRSLSRQLIPGVITLLLTKSHFASSNRTVCTSITTLCILRPVFGLLLEISAHKAFPLNTPPLVWIVFGYWGRFGVGVGTGTRRDPSLRRIFNLYHSDRAFSLRFHKALMVVYLLVGIVVIRMACGEQGCAVPFDHTLIAFTCPSSVYPTQQTTWMICWVAAWGTADRKRFL